MSPERTIIVLGNCVGAALFDVLRQFPELRRRFELALCKFGLPDPPDSVFRRCKLLIAHNRLFGAPTLSAALRDRLPTDCEILRLPTSTFGSLWPLTCRDPRSRVETEPHFRHVFPEAHADRLALDVMRRIPDPGKRVAAYLETPLDSVVDLERFHQVQAAQLVAAEQDADVRIAAYVLTHFRRDRVFFAHHHPATDLLLYQLAQIITHPTFAPYREGSVDAMLDHAAARLADAKPFHDEQVPVHPAIARFFELEWWSPDLKYTLEGGRYTFEEWLAVYMSTPLPPGA